MTGLNQISQLMCPIVEGDTQLRNQYVLHLFCSSIIYSQITKKCNIYVMQLVCYINVVMPQLKQSPGKVVRVHFLLDKLIWGADMIGTKAFESMKSLYTHFTL